MFAFHYILYVLIAVALLDKTETRHHRKPAKHTSPDFFCRVKTCSSHTTCKYRDPNPAPKCVDYKNASVTRQEIGILMKAHNDYRALVASGQETRGYPPGQRQPAGRIPPLKWSRKLAYVAQRWANQCSYGHDTCRDFYRFRVGQNYAVLMNTDGYTTTLPELVKMWTDEVEEFNPMHVASHQFFPNATIGHYTQVVWGKTKYVGCGVVRFKDGEYFATYLVCNYGPTGNWMEQPVYQTL